MKIVLIFRQPRSNLYSIETIFHTLAAELGAHAEIVKYEAGPRQRLLVDAWNLRRMRADVYHVTGDIHYVALLLPFQKTVLTLHDIGNYLHGLRGWKRTVYKWLWFLLPIRAARIVTAVSDETLRRVRTEFGTAANGRVVPNCYNRIFQRSRKAFNEETPVILQVGTQSHKNLERVIEAIRGTGCRLLIIGQLDGRLRGELESSKIGYEQYDSLPLEKIYRCYARADMLCFASTHEGFGMPIIEANAVGLPVITSNMPPMSDVAGGAACLVDPFDPASIREGVLRVIRDPRYRDGLIAEGLRNAERYSPGTIALRYLDIYREVAQRSPAATPA